MGIEPSRRTPSLGEPPSFFSASLFPVAAQETQPSAPAAQESSKRLQVNWLYGAFVPKDVPLTSLTNSQRGKLYLRQTYLGWGPYLKTGFFA